jgi:uncharacterized protein (TIGR00725 family)
MCGRQVFGSSRPTEGEPAYRVAEDLGKRIADAGFELMNGGYQGTMEASAKGASSSGGKVTGVLLSSHFPHRKTTGNDYLSHRVDTPSLMHRIGHMVESADYFLVLPGTLGTLTELCVAWNVAGLGELGDYPPPRVFAFRDPWEKCLPPLAAGLGIPSAHLELVTFVDNAAHAIDLITTDFAAKTPVAGSSSS